jgi:hypothetical protein
MTRVLLAGLASPTSLHGQLVRGQVVEEETARPLSGAFVVLLDDQGERRGAALADSTGRFFIRAPAAGRYTLRMERIGFESIESGSIALSTGEALDYRFVAPVRPVELAGISASGRGRCRASLESGAATSVLWEEARKAISIVEWVRTDRGVPYQALTYERARHLISLELDDQRTVVVSGIGRAPFYSEPAQDLAQAGYTRALPGGLYQYFGVDGPTLLSDEFLATHCFRVSEPGEDDQGLIGLGFEPIPTHHTPDIEGVLWLDRGTAELSHLAFRFTQHLYSVPIPDEPFGGRVEFRRLGNGAWIVDRWWLRMPQTGAGPQRGTDVVESRSGDGARAELLRAHRSGVRIWEAGGAVLFVAEPGTAARGFGMIEGVVFDSSRAAPLAGATVFLVKNRRHTRTASDGSFRIRGLAAGADEIAFIHPFADSLRLGVSPVAVTLRPDSATRADLHIPRGAGCPASGEDIDRGAVAGLVIDAGDGTTLTGVRVTARWRTRSTTRAGLEGPDRAVWALTDETGRFHFCVPVGDIRLTARTADGDAVAELTLRDPRLVQQDLLVR